MFFYVLMIQISKRSYLSFQERLSHTAYIEMLLYKQKKIRHLGNTMTFQVIDKLYKSKTFEVTINLPGIHYVRNALAAIALGLEYGVSVTDIKKGLDGFQGVARRYDIYPDTMLFSKKIILVDDYGHHPTEIDAVLEATKKGYPGKKN